MKLHSRTDWVDFSLSGIFLILHAISPLSRPFPLLSTPIPMKKIPTLLLSLSCAAILSGFSSSAKNCARQQVNPVIGDKSFLTAFGYIPDATTDNELRIKTHLAYAEWVLRQKDVSNLSMPQQYQRNYLLDLLHKYWTAGIFPRNYDYPDQRVPCFIDKEGRICAVGYLVEQTAGRDAAEEIHTKHKYETIYQMNDLALELWIAKSGLTKEECAMIQPAYGPDPVYSSNYISPDYGVASSLLSGLNLSFNTINGIQIANGAKKNTVPILALLTATGQLALGIRNFPKENRLGYPATSNESQKILSMVNIGFGTTTIILSTWTLIANRKPKTKLTSWNIYGIPTTDKRAGLALSVMRRF